MPDNSVRPGRKTTIEIPLTSIRKYVPGSGPPPPRITLVPPRDSTAYIIDQFVLPADTDTTETSRRLIHYHIGFTDLPAVKLLIPCNKVLDYVSPRELEDWEYANLGKKEEERARLLAEKERAGPSKRKPDRPPKVPMEDVGGPVLSPADEALLLSREITGPSLSTPQKRKLGRILDEEDTGETSNAESDASAIRRQLQGDAEYDSMGFEDDVGAESESADQVAFDYDMPASNTPSRTGNSVPPMQHSLPARLAASQPEPTAVRAPTPPAAQDSSRTPAPGTIHPAWAHAFGQKSQSETPPKARCQNGHAHQEGTPQSLPARPQQTNPPSSNGRWASFSNAASLANTSAPRAPIPGVRVNSAVPSDSSGGKRKARSPNGRQRKQQKEKKQKTKHEEQQPPADEWEVKELLDDQWVVENGLKVHKYLVLWVGDWPEGQNPTWEPAENVQDQGLIRRYQKKKKAGLLPPVKKAQKTLHHYLAASQYASVAEAFEGGIDEQLGPVAGDIESNTDPPNETFLVTENAGDISANGSNPSPSFQTFDSMLARYNQSFSRA